MLSAFGMWIDAITVITVVWQGTLTVVQYTCISGKLTKQRKRINWRIERMKCYWLTMVFCWKYDDYAHEIFQNEFWLLN